MVGMFYPADPEELSCMIEGFLEKVESSTPSAPKALIVPHAGYIYSGPVAACAYASLQPDRIERVVLIGPSHRVLLRGLAAPESLIWETPLGRVPVDVQWLGKISTFPQLSFSDVAHEPEHSLEVQLPFLQAVLDKFQLVPLLVGNTSKEEVAEVLSALWGGPETLIIVSSDLSHYENYNTARAMDAAASDSILALDERGLESDNACGFVPIRGLLHVAKKKGMRGELLDLRNSGDTAGPKNQVVGYGAYAFYE